MKKIKTLLFCASVVFSVISQTRAETIYRATTTIGDKIFQDIITLETMNEDVKNVGTLTVPGKFSVPIEASIKRTEEDVNYGLGRYLFFKATITENGQTFIVHYELISKEPAMNSFVGSLSDDAGSTLGHIVAAKIFN